MSFSGRRLSLHNDIILYHIISYLGNVYAAFMRCSHCSQMPRLTAGNGGMETRWERIGYGFLSRDLYLLRPIHPILHRNIKEVLLLLLRLQYYTTTTRSISHPHGAAPHPSVTWLAQGKIDSIAPPLSCALSCSLMNSSDASSAFPTSSAASCYLKLPQRNL